MESEHINEIYFLKSQINEIDRITNLLNSPKGILKISLNLEGVEDTYLMGNIGISSKTAIIEELNRLKVNISVELNKYKITK